MAKFFRALDYPKYERKVEFAGLVSPREYAFYDGKMGSTEQASASVEKFYKELSEKQTEDDPTKRASHEGKSFMIGAIARLNLSHKNLGGEAKKFLTFFEKSLSNSPFGKGRESAGAKTLTYNTFHNIYAQAVELVNCVEEVKKLLGEYLKDKSRILSVKYSMKNGEGLAATEAPRGTLYHYYKIDKYGVIRACNIITPTAQFLDNLENDLKKYLSEVKVKNERDRKWKINMMVRAYDPCMTCATH